MGFLKDAPLTGASIANRHLNGFGGDGDRTLVNINERLRVALLFAGGAQFVDEEEAISGVLQPSNHLLPLSPEFCEGWSKGHVVDGLPLALCPLPLLDGLVGVNEGPIVSDLELGQQLERDGIIALIGSQVGVGQHYIVDSPQQRDLVARYLRIVLEDSADDCI